jgi:hypothetical protein
MLIQNTCYFARISLNVQYTKNVSNKSCTAITLAVWLFNDTPHTRARARVTGLSYAELVAKQL